MIRFLFQIDTERCSAWVFCAEMSSYLGKKNEEYKRIKSCLVLRCRDVLKISLMDGSSSMNGTSKSIDNKY